MMNRIINVLSIIALFLSLGFGAGVAEQSDKDAKEILRLHKELIDAHKAKDVDKLLASEPDRVFSVSRGEIIYQTKAERISQFTRYLESTRFEEYRDLIDPIIHVSDDGTLGWLIAQVKISGTRTGDGGTDRSFESVWAWIELFEKKDGRWYRIGDVSNVRPDNR